MKINFNLRDLGSKCIPEYITFTKDIPKSDPNLLLKNLEEDLIRFQILVE